MESSSSSSSSTAKVELIQQTIERLIIEEDDEGNKASTSSSANREDSRRRLVLTQLLSQLDVIRAEKLQQCKLSCDTEEIACDDGEAEHINEPLNKMEVGSCGGTNNEEIAHELKKVKRQNFVTHCLLVVMIVLTIGWQISEVSLLWNLKDRMSHPFRSLGSMVKGMLKRPQAPDQEGEIHSFTKEKLHSTKKKLIESIKQSSTREKLIEAVEAIKQSSAGDKLIEALETIEGSSIQGLKIQELLRMELPSFDSSINEV